MMYFIRDISHQHVSVMFLLQEYKRTIVVNCVAVNS